MWGENERGTAYKSPCVILLKKKKTVKNLDQNINSDSNNEENLQAAPLEIISSEISKIRKTCQYCFFVSFENPASCLTHIETVHTNQFHGKKVEDEFKCVTCNKNFENDQSALGKLVLSLIILLYV